MIHFLDRGFQYQFLSFRDSGSLIIFFPDNVIVRLKFFVSMHYSIFFVCALYSLSKMERDHSQAINEHKTMVKQLNKKTDTSIEGMKQQHSAAIAKV